MHEEATAVLYGRNEIDFEFPGRLSHGGLQNDRTRREGEDSQPVSSLVRIQRGSLDCWTWDLCEKIQGSILLDSFIGRFSRSSFSFKYLFYMRRFRGWKGGGLSRCFFFLCRKGGVFPYSAPETCLRIDALVLNCLSSPVVPPDFSKKNYLSPPQSMLTTRSSSALDKTMPPTTRRFDSSSANRCT